MLWNLEYWKYSILHTFLSHALAYWAEMLYMNFIEWTSDQVRVSSIFVGVMPLLELSILETHSFPHFSPMWFDILRLKCCIRLSFNELQIKLQCHQFSSILSELFPFWNWKYLKYSFPHSYHTLFDISSWNVVYDFLFMNFRSSDCHYLGSCLKELCPLRMFSFAHFCMLWDWP